MYRYFSGTPMLQSRTQSLKALWPTIGCLERPAKSNIFILLIGCPFIGSPRHLNFVPQYFFGKKIQLPQALSREDAIAYPDSADSLASGFLLGETLGSWNCITCKTMQAVTGQPIKKIIYFLRIPRLFYTGD